MILAGGPRHVLFTGNSDTPYMGAVFNLKQYGPMVIETLAGFGLVRPDGKIMRPRVDKPSPLAAGGEEPSKIWTPDSDRPANKPALWVPGS